MTQIYAVGITAHGMIRSHSRCDLANHTALLRCIWFSYFRFYLKRIIFLPDSEFILVTFDLHSRIRPKWNIVSCTSEIISPESYHPHADTRTDSRRLLVSQHSFLGRWKSFTSFHGTSWILRIRLRAWDDEKSRPMRDVGPDAGYIINVVRIWFPGNRLQDSERLSVHTACRSVCSLCTCLALMSTPTFQINSFNLRLFDLCVQSADISPKCSPT